MGLSWLFLWAALYERRKLFEEPLLLVSDALALVKCGIHPRKLLVVHIGERSDALVLAIAPAS